MRPECSGNAIFRVIATDKQVKIPSDELEWQDEVEEGSESSMGPRRTHYAEAEVGDEGHTVVWNLWEYPLGAPEDSQTEYNKEVLELVQDFDYRLVHDPEDRREPEEPEE
ncbi:hypothetical protein DFR29_113171 [Tahibacter aquaticus]|uniref:Uncharacterized protein n=1 Tax=Tahibacter aquaticus TaxID=520092 RepID=A0A4R6YRG7_9GAMM|nr:hypothetical protein [Tahibacter aquaticus]TDR40469.1 hypothetical protein DFR29_113171 [Tahibacter aquaticus]